MHHHPLNHVNMSQSTNDVYPDCAACRISLKRNDLDKVMLVLSAAFRSRVRNFLM